MNNDDTSCTIQLPDSRRLGYEQYGSANGRPVLYFHGLPGSRYECRLLHASAVALNVRVIAVDRPGYGLSGFQPDRRLLDWPNDVREVANALNIDTFGILAVSGGAPGALACAHEIPDRITAIAIVCGLGPVYEAALRRQLRCTARYAFYLAGTSPLLLHALFGQPLRWLSGSKPELLIQLLALINGSADKHVLKRPEITEVLSWSLREAFRQGPQGAVQEVEIYRKPWGFDLKNISKHIHLWHGDVDNVVYRFHSEYLHTQLPYSELSIVPGEGHFSLPVMFAKDILKALIEESWKPGRRIT